MHQGPNAMQQHLAKLTSLFGAILWCRYLKYLTKKYLKKHNVGVSFASVCLVDVDMDAVGTQHADNVKCFAYTGA
jgi:hypothetical protein